MLWAKHLCYVLCVAQLYDKAKHMNVLHVIPLPSDFLCRSVHHPLEYCYFLTERPSLH